MSVYSKLANLFTSTPKEDVLTPPPPKEMLQLSAPKSNKAVKGAQPPSAATEYAPRYTARMHQFAGYTPAAVANILQQILAGQTERWADFSAHMMRTDTKLRSLVESLALSVASGELTIEPGDDRPVSQLAADVLIKIQQETPGWTDFLTSLLYAEQVGFAAAEHDWSLVNNVYVSTPRLVQARDIRFSQNWDTEIRVWSSEVPPDITPIDQSSIYYWANIEQSSPNRWIIHTPSRGEPPTQSGTFHTLAWIWVFKHWARLWHQTALERLAEPFIYGKVDSNSPAEVRDAMMQGLSNLNGDQVAVFESLADGSDPINIVDATSALQQSPHLAAIANYNEAYAEALVGSTLPFGGGEISGNRALAETQLKATFLPRIQAQSDRLAQTLQTYWAAPTTQLNSHLFGNEIPAIPKLSFSPSQEDVPTVTPDGINAGTVTNDELRRSQGLEPKGGEWGSRSASLATL